MDVQKAYDNWAPHYDTNQNKTRDLEARSIRETLSGISFHSCLELGCGTGKNTRWLMEKGSAIDAVDFSEKMLRLAKKKIQSDKVTFHRADIRKDWSFTRSRYDLITFSLVLEHIENLDDCYRKAANILNTGGYVYIGELHPFKQYSGTRARFNTKDGTQIVECFTHHISDFTQAAHNHDFDIVEINEFFDSNTRSEMPRILTLLLRKR